jgi:hypothetical protein
MRLQAGERSEEGIEVRARWPLAELRPPKYTGIGAART